MSLTRPDPAPVWTNPVTEQGWSSGYDYRIPQRTLKSNSQSTELLGGSRILCPASITLCFERCITASIVIACVSTLMPATYCYADIPCRDTRTYTQVETFAVDTAASWSPVSLHFGRQKLNCFSWTMKDNMTSVMLKNEMLHNINGLFPFFFAF